MEVRVEVHHPRPDGPGSLDLVCPAGVRPRDIEDGPVFFSDDADQYELRRAASRGELMQTEGMRLFLPYHESAEAAVVKRDLARWLRSLGHTAVFVEPRPSEARTITRAV